MHRESICNDLLSNNIYVGIEVSCSNNMKFE